MKFIIILFSSFPLVESSTEAEQWLSSNHAVIMLTEIESLTDELPAKRIVICNQKYVATNSSVHSDALVEEQVSNSEVTLDNSNKCVHFA